MTDGLRVLQVVQSLNVGGLETVVIELCRKLVALGVHTDVCCIEEPGELAGKLAGEAIEVFSLDKPAGIHLGSVRRLRQEIQRRGYHVIHSHSSMGHFYGCLAAKLGGRPIVHTRHQMSRTLSWKQKVRARLCAMATQRMIGVSAAVTQCNVADYSLPESRVRTIYNGIDTARFEDIPAPSTIRVIGTIGRLQPVKNQLSLLRVFERLVRRHSDLRLRIVGSGQSQQELEEYAKAAGLSERVDFAGYQSDIPQQMAQIDAFVMSSLSEGMPIVLIEAMAAARPVVVTAVGGIPEMIEPGKTGLMVERRDDDALEAAIRQLIEHPEQAAGMAKQARQDAVERFDIGQMASHYIAEYRSMARLDP